MVLIRYKFLSRIVHCKVGKICWTQWVLFRGKQNYSYNHNVSTSRVDIDNILSDSLYNCS